MLLGRGNWIIGWKYLLSSDASTLGMGSDGTALYRLIGMSSIVTMDPPGFVLMVQAYPHLLQQIYANENWSILKGWDDKQSV